MLLHAREGHVEPLGKLRDRCVCTADLLQNAASGGVRKRGERAIEASPVLAVRLVRQIHLLQERFVARVLFKLLQGRLAFDAVKIWILLGVSEVEPLECLI
jgi:hypothetical protein